MIAPSIHNKPRPDSLLISEEEAARQLDCCRQTVAQLRKDGELKAVRVRGSIKYPRVEIERFVLDQLNKQP